MQDRIPILLLDELLLVTIQVDMHDRLALQLQDDLTTRISETGAKGAVIVEVADRVVVSVEPIELDVIRWAIVEVDCTGATGDEVQSRMRDALVTAHANVAGGRPLVTRLVLAGESQDAAAFRERETALRDDARAVAVSISADLWIEKVKVHVREPAREAALEMADDLSGLIAQAITDPDLIASLRSDLLPFLSQARAAIGEAGPEDELRLAANSDDWQRVLETAAFTLKSRMMGDV